jgi:hypothetical protein
MDKKWETALVALSIWLLAFPVSAGMSGIGPDALDLLGNEGGCHVLIMDGECAAFHHALASAHGDAARQRILSSYRALIRDRESACSCNRSQAMDAVYFPRLPAAQRF